MSYWTDLGNALQDKFLALNGTIQNHEDRIKKVEAKLPPDIPDFVWTKHAKGDHFTKADLDAAKEQGRKETLEYFDNDNVIKREAAAVKADRVVITQWVNENDFYRPEGRQLRTTDLFKFLGV